MNAMHLLPRVLRAGLLPLFVLGAAAQADEPVKGSVDPKAVELMAKVEAKMRAAQTIEVVRRSTVRSPGDSKADGWRVIKVQAQRPNRYRVETLEMDEAARKAFINTLRITDGKTRLTERLGRDGKPQRHVEHTMDEDTYVWDDDMQTLAGLYFTDDELPGIGHDWRARKLRENNFRWIRLLKPEKWQDKPYRVVEWGYDVGYYLPEEQVSYRQKMYVGADDLVHRVVKCRPQARPWSCSRCIARNSKWATRCRTSPSRRPWASPYPCRRAWKARRAVSSGYGASAAAAAMWNSR
jgi:hypothetical protein